MHPRSISQLCEKQLQHFLHLLLRVIQIDRSMIIYLPQTVHPVDHFRRPDPSLTRLQFLCQFATVFYTSLMHSHGDHDKSIQAAFNVQLKHVKTVPGLLRAYQQFRQLGKQLHEKDLLSFRTDCENMLQQLQKLQLQTPYQIIRWKLLSCVLLISVRMGRDTLLKNMLIKYLKETRQLVTQGLTKHELVTVVLVNMVRLLLSSHNEHFVYAQLQLQRLQKMVWSSLSKQTQASLLDTIQQCKQYSTQHVLKHPQHGLTRTISARRIIGKISTHCSDKLLKQLKVFTNSTGEYSPTERRAVSGHKDRRRGIMNSPKNSVARQSLHRYKETMHRIGIISFKNVLDDRQLSIEFEKQPQFLDESRRKFMKLTSRANLCPKRMKIYKAISDTSNKGVTTVSALALQQEMKIIPEFQVQKCAITFKEILFDCRTLTTTQEKNGCLQGMQKDAAYEQLTLKFVVAFRVEIATFNMLVERVEGEQLISCKVTSTMTNSLNPERMDFAGKSKVSLAELKEIIEHVHIYFQAIQEKVESRAAVADIQFLFKHVKNRQGIQLSQTQIISLLRAKQSIIEYYYFYFTWENKVVGPSLACRQCASIANDMDFSISLKQLKNDHQKCIEKFKQCKNQIAMNQCFSFLSYGRRMVYKHLIKLRGIFYIETVQIDECVYQSFKLANLKSNFTRGQAFIRTVDLRSGKVERNKRIDLRLQLTKKNQFLVFLLRNAIENYVERKHRKDTFAKLCNNIKKNAKQQQQQAHKVGDIRIQEVGIQERQLSMKNLLICSQLSSYLNTLRMHCQAYRKDENFSLKSSSRYVVKIGFVFFECLAYWLQCRVKVTKIRKYKGQMQYLMLAHHWQIDDQFCFIEQPYFKKIVQGTPKSGVFQANLTRQTRQQQYLLDSCNLITRKVLHHGQRYLFVAVTFNKYLFCIRVDIYDQMAQRKYGTYLSAIDYEYDQRQLRKEKKKWNRLIAHSRIDLQQHRLSLGQKEYMLFQGYGALRKVTDEARWDIEFIQINDRPCYLITNFLRSCLQIGTVVENPFNSKVNIFSDFCFRANKLATYSVLLVKLFSDFMEGKLMSTDEFEVEQFECTGEISRLNSSYLY